MLSSMHIMRKIQLEVDIDLFQLSLCFSDTKTRNLGWAAPRIYSLNRLETYLGTPLKYKVTLQVGMITDRR